VPEQSLVYLENGVLASMLFMLPLTLVSGENTFFARYIYAVCTDPAARSRGYSTALLDAAAKMTQGAHADILVPSSEGLFDYYAARGFYTQFHLTVQETSVKDNGEKTAALYRSSMTDMQAMRDRYFSNSALFGRWDRPALEYQDREARLSHAQTLRFDGGYALCCPMKDRVFIKEFVCENDQRPVLAAIARRFGERRLVIRKPAGAQPAPFAMTRWHTRPPEPPAGAAPPYFALALD
jgi:GNAT superfamily N-acetyltransferase